MAMIASAEKFLAIHLGGRYQSSMTPEVEKRLGEITVDPKDVSMPAVSSAAPAEVDVTGTWQLDALAGGQQIPITLVLKQQGNSFTGTVDSPQGSGKIEGGTVNGKSVVGVINIDLGGAAMKLDMTGTVDGTKISGSIEGPGIPFVSYSGTKQK